MKNMLNIAFAMLEKLTFNAEICFKRISFEKVTENQMTTKLLIEEIFS